MGPQSGRLIAVSVVALAIGGGSQLISVARGEDSTWALVAVGLFSLAVVLGLVELKDRAWGA